MHDALPVPTLTPRADTPAALAARLGGVIQEVQRHHGENGRIQHGYLHSQWGDAYFDGVILKLGQLHHLRVHLTQNGEQHMADVTCEPLTTPAELDPWVRVPSLRAPGEFHALRYGYECIPAEGGYTARRRPDVNSLHPIVNGQPDWETVSATLTHAAPERRKDHLKWQLALFSFSVMAFIGFLLVLLS